MGESKRRKEILGGDRLTPTEIKYLSPLVARVPGDEIACIFRDWARRNNFPRRSNRAIMAEVRKIRYQQPNDKLITCDRCGRWRLLDLDENQNE
jgi:hypothetical protein